MPEPFKPSVMEQQRMKIQLYNYFQSQHEDLFRTNKQEYSFQEMRYVETKFREWLYSGKDPLAEVKG